MTDMARLVWGRAGAVLAICWALNGCGGIQSSDILTGAVPQAADADAGYSKSVVIGSISGPPAPIDRQVIRALDASSGERGIALLRERVSGDDARLEGALTLAKSDAGPSLVSAWVLLDAQGNELARFTTAELVKDMPAGLKWEDVPEQAWISMSQKVMASVKGSPGLSQTR